MLLRNSLNVRHTTMVCTLQCGLSMATPTDFLHFLGNKEPAASSQFGLVRPRYIDRLLLNSWKNSCRIPFSSPSVFTHRNLVSFRTLTVEAAKDDGRRQTPSKNVGPIPLESLELPIVRAPPPVSAPSLTESPSEITQSAIQANGVQVGRTQAVNSQTGSPKGDMSLQGLYRKLMRQLSSFPLAIAELFVIAGLSAVGTIIEQGESPEFYFQNYSEEHPILGFLTWRWVLGLSLDHIYSAPYFLGLLVLLAASLVACTSTRQLPMVKVARRWSFLNSPAAVLKLNVSDTLPRARLTDLGTLLMAEGYQVFVRGPSLYGFKGLAGRLAPIGVHAALLLIMGGATLSAVGGYHGTVMVPQGLEFMIGDALAPKGFLSMPSPVMNLRVQVNKFYIDYRPTGEVAQFHSDLSLVDLSDKNVSRRTISVNDPFRYGGVTMYQTDWSISAIQVRVDGSEPFNLVMAPLQKGDSKLYGTFLPLGDDGLAKAKGISILARDLQSVVIYDQEGQFVGVRRPGSKKPIVVDNVSIVVDDVIGSTGLELKMDPGVPPVYAGFGGLMLTTVISYMSHSQVWALQNGSSLVVGGKSNRAKYEFERELNELLDLVPEIKTGINSTSGGEPVNKSNDRDSDDFLSTVPARVEDEVLTSSISVTLPDDVETVLRSRSSCGRW